MKPAQRAALGLLLRKPASKRALFWERKTLLFANFGEARPDFWLIEITFVTSQEK